MASTKVMEVTLMRNRSALLEVNIKLQDNAIGDRGCSALVTTLLLTRRPPAAPAPGYAAGARFSRPNPHRPLFRGDGARLWLRVAELDPPLRDDELANLAERIVEEVTKKRETARLPTTGTLFELRLDLQGGDVADDGVRGLVDALASLRDVAYVRDLRLYKNRVGDGGAAALAELLQTQRKPMEELHLSDNRVTDRRNGVRDARRCLADAAKRLRCGVCLAEKSACQRDVCAGASGVATAVHMRGFLNQDAAPRLWDPEDDAPPPRRPRGNGARRRRTGPAAARVAPQGGQLLAPDGAGGVVLRLVGESPPLRDEDAISVALSITVEVRGARRSASPAMAIHLDDNALGDYGAIAIAGALLDVSTLVRSRSCRWRGTASATRARVADLVESLDEPIADVDLSHNRLTKCDTLVPPCARRSAPTASWVLFEPSDVYKYGLRGSLQPAEQRSLQDRMLRKGCVSIVTVAPRKDSTAVSVLACLESLQDYSQEQIRAILDACMDDVLEYRAAKGKKPKDADARAAVASEDAREPAADDFERSKEDLEQAVAAEKKKKPKKKPKKAPAPPADAAAPPATLTQRQRPKARGASETEPPAKAPAPVVKAPAPVVKAPAPARALEEAAAASAARDAETAARVGCASLVASLDALGRDEWDYVVGSVDGGDGDNVSTVLDAFLPAFKELGDAALQGAAVACVLDGAKAGPAGDLADFVAAARAAVPELRDDAGSDPEEAHPDPGGEGDDDDEQTPMAPHVLRKWARVVAKAKRRDGTAEMTRAALRKAPAKRVSAEDAAKAKRKKDREDAARDSLERYGSRPSNGGWKSSIRSPNIVYGKESSKIRYFEGKVVSTSGQKEVIIKDDSDATKVPQVVKKNGTVRAAK
ncbi:hypothetical protein JL721_5386 [Aureococcus anophagefferens]|nr:hypothetical protein JL721_5386 [Aureococcus anophagefferens]